MSLRPIVALLGCLLGCTLTQTVGAQPESPALVVVVMIDQFRGDYIDAFRDHFTEGGFQRLLRDGAWMANAHFEYGMTATGPGHASLMTGTTPAIHGIVGNDWVEFNDHARDVYCCGDDSVRCLGYPDREPSGRSPANLRAETLSDAIKASSGGRSKVWTVALKDRAAVLPAGMRGDGAVWWDSASGRMVSSSFYASTLPAWVQSFNEDRVADRFFKKKWERLLPAALYGPRFLKSPTRGNANDRHHANAFPKVLGSESEAPDRAYYGALYNSPFGNELVLEAARRAIVAEKLGDDDVVDLLCMGFSSNDVVGHSYGPDSDEVMDCTLRTDRQLAEFFAWLDEHIGKGKYLVALSSDHGVGPMPEYASDLGLGAGRVNPGKMRKALNKLLAARYEHIPNTSELIAELNLPWLYLDEPAVQAAGLKLVEVARLAAQLAADMDGIERTFTFDEIDDFSLDEPNELRRAVRNSYFPGRSGHVYLHWKRYWYKGSKQAGHGAAYDYDQHVPVMIMGPGVKAGRYTQTVSPTGMVPTLCKILGIEPPKGATGRVYSEIMPAVSN